MRFRQILTISSSSRGHWVLPAGGIDPGEDAETAAVRETVEEVRAWLPCARVQLWI